MRVTSHCANHPSKKASQRCRTCGKWLCDKCLRRFGIRVYCGRRCQLEGLGRRALKRLAALARGPLHPAWVIAVVAGAAALLLTEVGLRVAELLEVSGGLDSVQSVVDPGADLSGKVLADGDNWRVEVRGTPGATVLVLISDHPRRVLTIGEDGRGEVGNLELDPTEDRVRIVPLASAALDLEPPPVSTSSRTPALSSTPTATPVPTRTPTATPELDLTPKPPSSSKSPAPPPAGKAGPTPAIAPPLLQLVADAGPRIAITFDGNASSNGTADLLETLQRHNLHVTLFVTGQFIERNPTIVRRAVLEGHEVGNHTFSHPHLTTYEQDRRHQLLPGMTRERFQRQLRRTEEAFFKATGRAMKPLWRAPYGEENRLLRGWALEMGYLHVRWSSLQGATLDTHDWVADEHSSLYKSSSRIMERLLSFPKLEGGIILMHMATDRSEPPWKELPAFLKALKERGLEHTTVSRLLEASPKWRPWLKRAEQRHREINGN